MLTRDASCLFLIIPLPPRQDHGPHDLPKKFWFSELIRVTSQYEPQTETDI